MVKVTPYPGYKVKTYQTIYDKNGSVIDSHFEAASDYKVRNKVVLQAPAAAPGSAPADLPADTPAPSDTPAETPQQPEPAPTPDPEPETPTIVVTPDSPSET